MTSRLTQEIRGKIAVWQEAYGSITQTQCLFTREFFDREFGFFLPELRNNASVENCYFQQDGASSHYARKVGDYLNQLFPDRWIGRRSPLEWATRSLHLTTCDFFLWGFLKRKVYFTRPQNLKELEEKLEYHVDSYTRFIAKCRARMRQKVVEMSRN